MGKGGCASFAPTFEVLGQQLQDNAYPGPQWTNSLGVFA